MPAQVNQQCWQINTSLREDLPIFPPEPPPVTAVHVDRRHGYQLPAEGQVDDETSGGGVGGHVSDSSSSSNTGSSSRSLGGRSAIAQVPEEQAENQRIVAAFRLVVTAELENRVWVWVVAWSKCVLVGSSSCFVAG